MCSDFRTKRVCPLVREAGVIGLTTITLHPSLHPLALLFDDGRMPQHRSLESTCHYYVLVCVSAGLM